MIIKKLSPIFSKIKISFSFTKNGQQSNHMKQKQSINNQPFTKEQEALIKLHKPDQYWNILVGVDKSHNFQKDLIVARKKYDRNTKQLRSAILFQDLLKSQVDILIYDTQGKSFLHHILRMIAILIAASGSFWALWSFSTKNLRNKIILNHTKLGMGLKLFVYIASIFLFIKVLIRHARFTRRYVEKIIYNTQTENFTFARRNIIGIKYHQIISRYKIVYTQSEFLNKKGTNYFHIDTKNQYSIAYSYAWKKEDLFSHLIAQRIKI